MIISDPFKFHPYWRKEIDIHISSLPINTNGLLDSLEHRMADNEFISSLREPTIAQQKRATKKLREQLESLEQALEGPHNLIARFEAENTPIRSILRELRFYVRGLQDLIEEPLCPAPYRNVHDPIQRIRKPHIRQIALIVCDWISSLEPELAIPLSADYDVITGEPWYQGKMSFASRLVELCIWDHETQQKAPDDQMRFIQTLEKTGQPRANLKTVMSEAVKLTKSNPIKD